MSMFIGEALAGDGNEVAHIDLLIGSKDGPVGVAFANALARQSEGHSNLLAVLTPNLAVKPATVMVTKVTIDRMSRSPLGKRLVCELSITPSVPQCRGGCDKPMAMPRQAIRSVPGP